MSNDEVNKIIAEYMGWSGFNDYYVAKKMESFTKSLDSLIPVWEKLQVMVNIPYGGSATVTGLGYSYSFREDKDTPQEAAAHATAKAILEINKS